MPSVCEISAIIVAYDREVATLETIRRIQSCDPAPREILVHLDGGANLRLPEKVKVIRSDKNIGPGGGRNLLIKEAQCEWVASFDDDSYPLTVDYFAKALEAVDRHSDCGILAAVVKHRDDVHDAQEPADDKEASSFMGGGCIYRRSIFIKTEGYIPLPVAYGMEEVDLALQLYDKGVKIIETPDLQVFHDSDLKHHGSSRITAGAIMNQALLVWVRYPLKCWPYGIAQWLNKMKDSIQRGRYKGTVRGFWGTFSHLWEHRSLRSVVSAHTVMNHRKSRVS